MILTNVKIVNFDSTIENADVEIKNNKIHKIKIKKGKAKNILVPGFIDQHIHGFKGRDAMDGKEAIEFMSEELAKFGTTSLLPTLMTSENLEQAIENSSTANTINSRILGFHIEGPFISSSKKGAHNEKYIEKATKNKINKMIKLSDNKIRKMTIAPENFPISLLNVLHQNQIISSIGHSNTSGEIAKEYFQAGVSSVTHLWNAMSGIANRNVGLVEQTLITDTVSSELILDLIHVDKSAIKLSIAAKGVETITLVTDAIRAAGLKDGESLSGGYKVVKKGGLITIKGTDTIAGSAATMIDNFKNVISIGYDLETAVAMTSYNSAVLLGEDNLGYIKEGMLADIIVLDQKFNIKQVIIDGKKID